MFPTESDESRDLLHTAIAKLHAAERDALLLRYFTRMDNDGVAAALTITPAAAQKRISRGVASLRRLLSTRDVHLSVAETLAVLSAGSVHADAALHASVLQLAHTVPPHIASLASATKPATWFTLTATKATAAVALFLTAATAVTSLTALSKPSTTPVPPATTTAESATANPLEFVTLYLRYASPVFLAAAFASSRLRRQRFLPRHSRLNIKYANGAASSGESITSSTPPNPGIR